MKHINSIHSLFVQFKDCYQEMKGYFALLFLPLIFGIILFLFIHSVSIGQLEQQARDAIDQYYSYSQTMFMNVTQASETIQEIWKDYHYGENLKNSPSLKNEITKSLDYCISGSPHLQYAYIIVPDQQLFLSNEAVYQYKSLQVMLGHIGLDLSHLSDYTSFSWCIQSENGMSLPCYVSPLKNDQDQLIGYIVIAMDRSAFLNTSFRLNAEFACFFNDHAYVTSKLMKVPEGIDWRNESEVQKLTDVSISCEYADIEDFTFMVALPTGPFYKPLRIILIGFILYAAAVFLLSFIYLFRISYRRYSHMINLVHSLPQDDGNVTYNNIITHVQNVLLESRDRMTRADIQMHSQKLRHIFQGHYAEITPELAAAAGVPFNGCFYITYTSLIRVTNEALDPGKTNDIREMVIALLISTIQELLPESLRVFPCRTDDLLCLLFHQEEETDFSEHILSTVNQANEILTQNYGVYVRFTISRMFRNFTESPAHFDNVSNMSAFAASINSPLSVLFTENITGTASDMLPGAFINQELTLLNTLTAKKYGLIPPMVEAIINEHILSLKKAPHLGTNRITALSSLLSESLLHEKMDGLDCRQASRAFRQITSVEELLQLTQQVFTSLSNIRTENTIPAPVRIACEYIRQNLSNQNLNVNAICEATNISVQRLMPMFNESMGTSIAKYVNNQRIQKVRELLTETNLTVVEIAEQVGYNNTDTLTRNFRKLENMTPTEYRIKAQ